MDAAIEILPGDAERFGRRERVANVAGEGEHAEAVPHRAECLAARDRLRPSM